MEKQKKCKELIGEHLKGRLNDLKQLWEAYQKDGVGQIEDLGNIYEYGLCFDYVPPGTWKEQKRGYFRYQLSWGGPSDEFRFYTGPEFKPYKIEYWYMDWFDGAKHILTGKYEEFMLTLWSWFQEVGAVERAYKEAQRK